MHWFVYTASGLPGRFLISLVADLRVTHAEIAARPGGYILALNHISHFDPPLVSTAMRRQVDWMAMRELFRRPLFAAWLRAMGAFPVDRNRPDRAAVRIVLSRLRKGRIVGIFPEGGIRCGPASILEGAPIRSGIATLAQLGGVPVVPCVILGSDRLYARRWLRQWRRTPVWITFGDPIHCADGSKTARDQLQAELGEALRALMAETQRRFGLTADDLPHAPSFRRRNR